MFPFGHRFPGRALHAACLRKSSRATTHPPDLLSPAKRLSKTPPRPVQPPLGSVTRSNDCHHRGHELSSRGLNKQTSVIQDPAKEGGGKEGEEGGRKPSLGSPIRPIQKHSHHECASEESEEECMNQGEAQQDHLTGDARRGQVNPAPCYLKYGRTPSSGECSNLLFRPLGDHLTEECFGPCELRPPSTSLEHW